MREIVCPASRSLALIALLLLLSSCGPGPRGQTGVLELNEARLRFDSTATPPESEGPGEPVVLPDRWIQAPDRDGSTGWYRFSLPDEAVAAARSRTDRLALFLPTVNMNAAAFVNGMPIGSGGRMEPPLARNSNRPLYWSFTSTLLLERGNRLDVRLAVYPNDFGLLGPVFFGPDSALRGAFERQHLVQVEISQVATAIMFLGAIFFFVLWIATGFEPVYGWLAVLAASWSVVSLNYWLRDPGVSHWTYVRAYHVALAAWTVTLPLWVHRLLGIERPRLEASLAVLFVLFASYAVFAEPEWFHAPLALILVLWLAISVYAFSVVVVKRSELSRAELHIYFASMVICLALAAYDFIRLVGWREDAPPYVFPFVGPLICLCFATTLGVRFAASLRESQRLNMDLEERVRAKTHELEENHARMRELEQRQLLITERERLVREMHDGLGGQLVATLAMVEGGRGSHSEVATALRDALDDMRVVIDSMDPDVDDLATLFGIFRARIDPLLRRNGLRFAWRVRDLPPTPWLGPEQYLHVLRILQEAVANVVKHADASEIEVDTRCSDEPPTLFVSVRDDGCGTDGSGPGGRGLSHMRQRARALGAELTVEPAHPGTRVELVLPLLAGT